MVALVHHYSIKMDKLDIVKGSFRGGYHHFRLPEFCSSGTRNPPINGNAFNSSLVEEVIARLIYQKPCRLKDKSPFSFSCLKERL
jgi:hypothetical protein